MLTTAIKKTTEYKRLLEVAQKKHGAIALFGLAPVARVAIVAALCEETKRPALVVTANEASATRFAYDAETFKMKSAIYPSRDFVMRNIEGQSREYEYRRLEVLGKLVGGRINMVAAPIEAVLQRTLPKEAFLAGTMTITSGQTLKQAELVQALLAASYFRRAQIEGPGQFSVRGDIVDIYAPDMKSPARIEYWGDEIESIHSFDIVSQRREKKLAKIYLSPAKEVLFGSTKQASVLLKEKQKNFKGKAAKQLEAAMMNDLAVLDGGVIPEGMDKYLPLRYEKLAGIIDYFENPILFLDEASAINEEAKHVGFRTKEMHKSLLEEGVLAKGLEGFYEEMPVFLEEAKTKTCIYCENFARTIQDTQFNDVVNLQAHSLPPWPGDVSSLAQELEPLAKNGYFCAVMAGTKRAAAALANDLADKGFTVIRQKNSEGISLVKGGVAVLQGCLSSGMEIPLAKFALFTSRRQNVTGQKKAKKKNKGLASLSDVKPGDYVVHQSHGIGIYSGIKRLDLQGVVKDYLKIKYNKADILYVPVTQLDLIGRYTAPGDGARVKLAKLGGTEWAKTKAHVRVATSEMAKDLILLYAKRQQASGFPFPEDNDWQRDFETRFEYEETQDQLISVDEIKHDMEKPHPMDRLLCGDVGAGKTEVALRAAFKCVMGGKQCAILVPTTILAWQHFNTMLARMEAFPVKREMLSRFRTPAQMKKALKGMAAGTVDIVVGTHRLLQKDVKFKDLGLLIVDEEQRFGVKHKEKLKEAFIGVDTLSLSATPIPRTLNMAMSGIRDMSTIEDPPFERQPVETYVMEFDYSLVTSAIKKELARAGQVYYLHNRVRTIEQTAAKLQSFLPEARIGVAHGKMKEEELSEVWQSLLNAEIDVLVCTTLIETGVDVRNCNTLIIEDADRMGLAQLYQIRGRVGRSNRKAYAYFTFRRDKVLTEIASKRLSAIREFTAFGSGFRIAMRDLQIRGAGNLLGQSQSGNMQAVGYDLYVKMLNKAVAAAKGEAAPTDKSETLIDITVDAFIPEKYIEDAPARIEAYKKIAAIENEQDAQDVLNELEDRYGEVKSSVKGLIDISLLRVVAAQLGIYEVVQRKDSLFIYSDKIDFARISPQIKHLRHGMLVNASAKPYLSIRVAQSEKPLELLNIVVNELREKTHELTSCEQRSKNIQNGV